MAEGRGAPAAPSATGRPPATSRNDLERVAFELFARHGFEQTTVDDIAAAAGVSRRTLFRYHASKKDLVWGDFDGQLTGLRDRLAAYPPDVTVMDALRDAVVWFNQVPQAELPYHRRRMELILRVPALAADATLRYASWRRVVAGFVADRTGQSPDAFLPRLVGQTALGAAMAAYEQWLDEPGTDLAALLDAAMRHLSCGLASRRSCQT